MSTATETPVAAPARPVKRPRQRRPFTRRQRIGLSALNLAVFFGVWELIARTTDIPKLFVPAPSEVYAALVVSYQRDILLPNLAVSLRAYVIGMVIAFAIAIPAGLLIGGIKTLDKIVTPYMWALYTLPRIILMPLVLLWVGFNKTATIVLVVVSAAPATIVFIMDGVKTVDTSLLRAARSFGARRSRLFTNVVFPATVPFIATGTRMGVARGLLGLFIGEIFTGATGIGYILSLAQKAYNSALIFGLLIIFVLFSLLMIGLTQGLERKASVWRA